MTTRVRWAASTTAGAPGRPVRSPRARRPPTRRGPFPLNLFLEPGDASVDEMIAATGHGLLVTRFHYSNVVHPREAVITGMTGTGRG